MRLIEGRRLLLGRLWSLDAGVDGVARGVGGAGLLGAWLRSLWVADWGAMGSNVTFQVGGLQLTSVVEGLSNGQKPRKIRADLHRRTSWPR